MKIAVKFINFLKIASNLLPTRLRDKTYCCSLHQHNACGILDLSLDHTYLWFVSQPISIKIDATIFYLRRILFISQPAVLWVCPCYFMELYSRCDSQAPLNYQTQLLTTGPPLPVLEFRRQLSCPEACSWLWWHNSLLTSHLTLRTLRGFEPSFQSIIPKSLCWLREERRGHT